jgi:hypothetical protein
MNGPSFACGLRSYEPIENRNSDIISRVRKRYSYVQEKNKFQKYFSKERPVVDSNYHIGGNFGFLPPMNRESKVNLNKIPVLRIND